mmetsp:Transcript_6046/g.20335  ORF Transcript_6046/g.20335 Transcript_6046/m.20335 type:complete len:430 (-) Transcript_6046:103-1392(-)
MRAKVGAVGVPPSPRGPSSAEPREDALALVVVLRLVLLVVLAIVVVVVVVLLLLLILIVGIVRLLPRAGSVRVPGEHAPRPAPGERLAVPPAVHIVHELGRESACVHLRALLLLQRHGVARVVDELERHLREHEALLVAVQLGKHASEGVDYARVPVRLSRLVVAPRLCRGHHVALRLDGARPQEHLPVEAPCGHGEGARHEHHVRAHLPQRSVEAREPHVEARCHPERAHGALAAHEVVARLGEGGLPEPERGCVEEVHLAVHGRHLALVGNNHVGVANLGQGPAGLPRSPGLVPRRGRGRGLRAREAVLQPHHGRAPRPARAPLRAGCHRRLVVHGLLRVGARRVRGLGAGGEVLHEAVEPLRGLPLHLRQLPGEGRGGALRAALRGEHRAARAAPHVPPAPHQPLGLWAHVALRHLQVHRRHRRRR